MSNPPVNVFARTFTRSEWEKIEEWLIEEINKIVIPDRVTPEIIQQLNAQIDKLTVPVMWLYALTKRNYESLTMDRKNAERQVYLLVKDEIGPDGKPTGKKRTEKETEAHITQYLNTTPLQKADGTSMPAPIYVMEKSAMERFVFMQAVVDMLKQKSDKLITDLGAIKVEAQVTSGGIDDDEDLSMRRTA